MARACLLVVNVVVCESKEGDRFLFRLLVVLIEELLLELLLELEELEDTESRRRRPFPRAHREIARSIVEGMMLKRSLLEDDDDDDDELGAPGEKGPLIGDIGLRGSGPL